VAGNHVFHFDSFNSSCWQIKKKKQLLLALCIYRCMHWSADLDGKGFVVVASPFTSPFEPANHIDGALILVFALIKRNKY
jgi:hypothetical protein